MNYDYMQQYAPTVPMGYMGYSQMPYQQRPASAPQQTTPYTNKVYVSGIEGARSYPLQPNSEMILCDDNKDIIYDVVVDASGKRSITPLDICVHQDAPPVDFSQFATKDDIAKLKEEFNKRNKTTSV